MYPVVPLGALGGTLVRTGFPVALLLGVATIALVAGLLFLRAGAITRSSSTPVA